jgi:hypothetical protein
LKIEILNILQFNNYVRYILPAITSREIGS